MKRVISIVAILSLFTIFTSQAFSAIPQTISYQGYLTDNAGAPIDTTVNITFKIYDDPSGGTALWTSPRIVQVSNGVYSIQLGSVTPLVGLQFDVPYFLGIDIESNGEMTPRQAFESVPYSVVSAQAEVAQSVASGVVTDSSITGPISAAKIDSNGLNADLLDGQDGSYYTDWSNLTSVPQVLSSLICADGQIAKYVGSVWTCVTEPDYLLKSGDTVLGPLQITGNSTLGNNFTDTIIFMGRVNSSFLPTMDNTYDLGSTLNHWRDIYANAFVGDGSGLTTVNADLLDGQDGDYYNDWGNLTNMPADIADGDGLGDHTALSNITLGSYYISGDGGDEGIRVDPVGNTTVNGDLTVSGTISGNIDISQVTGLLGGGYTIQIPDVLNNTATLEIAGINTMEAVVVSGPGYDIERIEGFDGLGRPADLPGFANEHAFIFEAGGQDAVDLIDYVDGYAVGTYALKDISMIVDNLAGSEVFRWNAFNFEPVSYEPGSDGRTRFAFINYDIDNTTDYQFAPGEPFGSDLSNNMATDTKVELSGVNPGYFEVVHDETNRTLTITYDFVEGFGLFNYMAYIVSGVPDKRSLDLIYESGGVEISRENYYGVFPMKYEQYYGYGLSSKIKGRITMSYDYWQQATPI